MMLQTLGFTVLAIHQIGGNERVVAAAHIALGLAGFFLGNGMFCHVGYLPVRLCLFFAYLGSTHEYSKKSLERQRFNLPNGSRVSRGCLEGVSRAKIIT
jgi:hypothetical protein